jgi:DNA-binding LytR/AlgR family response regulator
MNKEDLILIVEDELLIAENISRILRNAGYESVQYVTNVDEAIGVIETQKPQIVLTDIMLEGERTGIDLGNLIHSQYKIPFVYITSHSSPEMVAKVKFTHPNAYLVKPFKKEDLVVAIELALFNVNPAAAEQFLQIKDGHVVAQIPCSEILWLEAEGNYTVIFCQNTKRRLVRNVITELHSQLPNVDFVRIHRSYVVNKKMISEYSSAFVVINEVKLPVGRTYREKLNEI